jgi:heme A synthase
MRIGAMAASPSDALSNAGIVHPSRVGSAVVTQSSRYSRFAWAVLGYTLFVILWGAFVRATGSGAGCGSHWPLCNGAVVPRSPAAETVIEFGHRLTSGIALLMVGALLIGAWRRYPTGHVVRRAAAWSAFFLVSEALIGAGLVLLELVAQNRSLARGYWVAGHLINTFLLVAALTLTAWFTSGHAPPRLRDNRRLAWSLAVALGGLLLLAASGAVTALGDTLFPAPSLAEAKALTFSDAAHFFVRLRVWHPVLALVLFCVTLYALWDTAGTNESPAVNRLAAAVFALFTLQLAVGALNVFLLAPVAVQLVHLLLAHAIWIAMILLGASALATGQQGRQ